MQAVCPLTASRYALCPLSPTSSGMLPPMSPSAKVFSTAGLLAILLVLGSADAYFTGGLNALPAVDQAIEDDGPDDTGTGVARRNGADVFDILNELGIVTESTREESLLDQIVPDGTVVEKRVILDMNDRLGFFSWVETADVKVYLSALKDALRSSFSSQMRDLVDEVQERDGKPVRDVLSFLDPAINGERILFVRVRQRLFEFHVPEGKEEKIQEVMDALTD